jgi:hypothetical protein
VISINEKRWLILQENHKYDIDDITYYDLIVYQEAKLKII